MKYIWCNNIKCEPNCKSTKSDSLCLSCKHKDICMDSSLKEQINHERKCVISCDMVCKDNSFDKLDQLSKLFKVGKYYHGDDILAAITCIKENRNIRSFDEVKKEDLIFKWEDNNA